VMVAAARMRSCAPVTRLRSMRSLKQLRSVRMISVGHAFIQYVRRGHYELATDVDPNIGARLRSPSSHAPSNLEATEDNAAHARTKQQSQRDCWPFNLLPANRPAEGTYL
jgi:hypothetical protein